MSDNHERFSNNYNSVNSIQSTTDTAQPSTAQTQQPGYTPYGAQPAQQQQPAYTWNGGQYSQSYTPYTYPVQQPQKQQKRKRSGAPLGVKIIAVVLCCVLTSMATLGIFMYMVQNGVVQVQSENGGNAAFTISRVVSSEPQETGTVSALTEQDIAAKLIPSVVCIQNYQIPEQYGLFGYHLDTSSVSPAGEGSGIIFREDGYIVTNAHVVDGATELKVILSDDTTYEAALIGSDEVTDLAVLKIEASGLTPAEFGSSEDLRVADRVMAIGNPGGHTLSSTVTIGYVSALNRSITNSETGYAMEYIQTDAAINPGNSGGALVNSYGQVVGINSAKINATGYEGLGFAIPSDFAQHIISNLMEYGYVRDRAMLGISGQYVDMMTGRFYGLPQGEYVGALNTERAAASGLQIGDVITAIDGAELTSETVLRTLLNTKKPGETSTLTVYRPQTGETVTLTLTYSEYTGE